MILNLTQHKATAEQVAACVVDVATEDSASLVCALTFEVLPTALEILERAEYIGALATDYGHSQAMIGGALWLMAPLAAELRARGIEPLFAFSVRESAETVQPDGSVRKTMIFRHAGFVPAI